MKNSQRFLKRSLIFSIASLKNVFQVVRPWELVRSKVLASVNMLHTFKNFIRPLEKILERFKVNISFKNEGFSRVDSHNNFKQNFKKSPLLYVCVIKKCFWGRTTMGIIAFENFGFRVMLHTFKSFIRPLEKIWSSLKWKLHSKTMAFLELFRLRNSEISEWVLKIATSLRLRH